MSVQLGYCIVSLSPVRSEHRDSSEMVTQLLFGEIVTIEEINSPWCKIQTYSDNYSGYVDIKHIHLLSERGNVDNPESNVQFLKLDKVNTNGTN